MSSSKKGKKNSHCSFCGQAFEEYQSWPRRCPSCLNLSFLNPLPVSVILLPVNDGILLIRRAVPPGVGLLALPGGYINSGESWQEAGARELQEETGVIIPASEITAFRVSSAPDSTILIFGLALPRTSVDLPPFIPTDETTERLILREPVALAFSLHTDVLRDYFHSRSL